MGTQTTLREDRAAAVRDRVVDGVTAVIEAGDDLTFATVAAASGVSERTVYRHFPTREALLTAVFEAANRRMGFDDGEPPTDGAGMVQLVRRAFPGFDDIAPVVRELLIAPEGLPARLSTNDRRRRAAPLAVAAAEAPKLGREDRQRLAATLQVLTAASTWQVLREYWDMDGVEAGETAAFALELVVEAARGRSDSKGSR